MITYKFRIYPSKAQQTILWSHANKLNFLYNYFLNQRKTAYEKDKTTITRYDQQKELVVMKKSDVSLKEIHSQVLQQVPLRLSETYDSFFKRYKHGQGFPKFRSCKKFFGITYPQSGYIISDNFFKTKAYGKIKISMHRKIHGNVKQVKITCDGNNWYLCIVTDYMQCSQNPTDMVGCDVGITNIAALSNREVIKNATHAKYFDKKINALKSKRDSSTIKGSRRNKFFTKVIKRLYGAKERKIKDFLHKVSKTLSSKYDTIVLEDLNLKAMSEKNITGLNRELRNSKIALFIQYLQYKTKNVVFVNPMNTSKTCNNCGKLHSMGLSHRTMQCECGYIEDRDVNAAKNILCLGQAYINGYSTECSIQEALSFR